MKTLRNHSASLFTLGAALLLSLTSCQKDELSSPNALVAPPVDQAADINPDGNKQPFMTLQRKSENEKYQMIEIFSNGELIATEYQNGSLFSKKAIMLSGDQLTNVRNKVRQYNLSALPVQLIDKNQPTITLAFQDDPNAKSVYIAVNENKLNSLCILAGEIKEMTNTSEFFNQRDTAEHAPVSLK